MRKQVTKQTQRAKMRDTNRAMEVRTEQARGEESRKILKERQGWRQRCRERKRTKLRQREAEMKIFRETGAD